MREAQAALADIVVEELRVVTQAGIERDFVENAPAVLNEATGDDRLRFGVQVVQVVDLVGPRDHPVVGKLGEKGSIGGFAKGKPTRESAEAIESRELDVDARLDDVVPGALQEHGEDAA